jgi:hypothetical protein
LEKVGKPGVAEITALKEGRVRKVHNDFLKKGGKNDKIIVCYRPIGRPSIWGNNERVTGHPGATAEVAVFATRFQPNYGTEVRRYRVGPWWYLGRANVPVYHVVRPAEGSIFGQVAETPIRALFSKWLMDKYQHKVTNPDKRPDDHGPDVTWEMIAEMYAELARTTNDEFLAELANELVTLG